MKAGIKFNCDFGKGRRLCIRKFWGKSRNGLRYDWTNRDDLYCLMIVIWNLSFDFIVWKKSYLTDSNKGSGGKIEF